MAQGLQIFGPDGSLVLDSNTRVTKILGSAFVSSDGSMSVAIPGGGSLFAYIVAGASVGPTSLIPIITISGNSISWQLNPRRGSGLYDGFSGVSNLLVWGTY